MVRFRAEMIAPIGLMLLLLLFAAVRMIGKKRRISKPITVKTVIAGIAMAALLLMIISGFAERIWNIFAPI
ncbi:MAG TPA: hypothetical protein DDX71_05555 [Ruminococcus sp.]|nr:hypothetical protein [Ruminococcus sp.]